MPPNQRDYEAMLNPDELRASLLSISLFVMAFEMFRAAVIDHPQTLYSNGFDASGWRIDKAAYEAHVTSKHRSLFRASLQWFLEQGAISDADVQTIGKLQDMRNRLVHELGTLIGTLDVVLASQGLVDLLPLYRKVEVWWIRNFEMEFNDEINSEEIADDDIQPGPMIMFHMLFDVAFGDKEQAWQWYHGFRGAMGKVNASDALEP